MRRGIAIAGAVVLLLGVLCAGCDVWMVGAPCVPETDNGEFKTELADDTYAVETRSVQCETSLCITLTKQVKPVDASGDNIFEKYKDTQEKYSFCSCRCRDAEGHGYDQNSDKYDDLCECPTSTQCVSVLGNNIEDAPEKVKGSYCIPNCVIEGCAGMDNEGNRQKCTPSSDSEEPWKWRCK